MITKNGKTSKFLTVLLTLSFIPLLTACTIPFQEWTLFTFDSEYPDFDYLRGRIDGYESKEKCLNSGLAAMGVKKGSFECGYDCSRFEKKYGIGVCDKVCGLEECRN